MIVILLLEVRVRNTVRVKNFMLTGWDCTLRHLDMVKHSGLLQ